jgi:hypothetical protein
MHGGMNDGGEKEWAFIGREGGQQRSIIFL